MKSKLLESLEKVFESSKESGLRPVLFAKLAGELETISGYFGITLNQAFVLSLVIAINCQGETADLKDLTRHLGCSGIKLLQFSDDIDQLRGRGILKKEKIMRHRHGNPFQSDQLRMNDTVMQAILNGRPLPEIELETVTDVFDLLHQFALLLDRREEEDISSEDFFHEFLFLMKENQQFPLIKKVTELSLDKTDAYMYLHLVWKTLSGHKSLDISSTIENIIDNSSRKVRYLQNMVMQQNDLIKLDLVELEEAGFFNDTEMKLSDKSIKMLQELGINLFSRNTKSRNTIQPDSIRQKELVFNADENRQLQLVGKLLEDKHLQETRARLREKNLPTGIAILLHGSPGTGKTETVFQSARETGREILKVDISDSKSMWFGESEKIIKRIFTDYRSYAADCERLPILLFNEADSILSKRKSNGSSSVSQTENAMQGIILEELERFDGIFMATTNLVGNLDAAFDRRFLFKIEFRKPDQQARTRIWKLKIPSLTRRECESLAGRFEFSGGQIDNIARKAEIHGIVYGKKFRMDQLVEFCEAEQMIKSNPRPVMGFRRQQDRAN